MLHPKGVSDVLTSILAIISEELLDFVTNITLGDLDIVLGGTIVRHEREETVVSNVKLEKGYILARAQQCGVRA